MFVAVISIEEEKVSVRVPLIENESDHTRDSDAVAETVGAIEREKLSETDGETESEAVGSVDGE